MSDKIDVNGNCHCGNIYIQAKVRKSEVRACHCTDCQKMSGAPVRAVAIAPAEEIKITGKPGNILKKRILEIEEYKHFVQIVGPNFLRQIWRENCLI